MTRRNFMLLALLLGTGRIFGSTGRVAQWQVISVVMEHLFPRTSKFSGARVWGVLRFLKQTSENSLFDREDLELLHNGAKELLRIEKDFVSLSVSKKEKVLRRFEENDFGQRWLSTLIYYGLEAVLGDPIYAGNVDGRGWNEFGHRAGMPRPKVRYGKTYGGAHV
ncbi:MAG TPA: hypothetical protein EYG98_06830 [Sulfurovum sp.]|nr:hypothetical protein [Sulfurovum sp.]